MSDGIEAMQEMLEIQEARALMAQGLYQKARSKALQAQALARFDPQELKPVTLGPSSCV